MAGVAVLLAGCGQGGLERLAAGETGKVVSVHSGDSFTLDSGLEVRLAGVEAPRGDQAFADQARTLPFFSIRASTHSPPLVSFTWASARW